MEAEIDHNSAMKDWHRVRMAARRCTIFEVHRARTLWDLLARIILATLWLWECPRINTNKMAWTKICRKCFILLKIINRLNPLTWPAKYKVDFSLRCYKTMLRARANLLKSKTMITTNGQLALSLCQILTPKTLGSQGLMLQKINNLVLKKLH